MRLILEIKKTPPFYSMQEQSPNFAKSKSEACLNFWQPLVKKIYAYNTDGIFPSKEDVCAAFIRLQKARLNVGFEISYKQESRGYRERDETLAICISKSFGGAGFYQPYRELRGRVFKYPF
jgi:hypothetical protein